MTRTDLVAALASAYPEDLCRDLVDEYTQMRCDAGTGTLSRSSPGKFVETFAQMLEFLEKGTYSAKPDVDKVLLSIEQIVTIDEGIRICGVRMARAIYALRNKRSIAHKNLIDPNIYDLNCAVSVAQWILTELLRHVSKLSMAAAGKLIGFVQAPIGHLVQDIGMRRMVLVDCSAREEILILLRSYYPEGLPIRKVLSCLDRLSEKTVRNTLRTLWQDKAVDVAEKGIYLLTLRGLQEASLIARKLQAA